MRICLIKTSSMGDILHSLPALSDAQQALPCLKVDWVVESPFAEIARWHPTVERVIPIDLRRWRKTLFQPQTWRQWQAYKQQLGLQHYDAVIDAQGLFKSAFFATRLAYGKKHGYDRRSIREPIACLYYDKRYAISYQQHAVERIRQLMAKSLNYPLPTTAPDYGIASQFKPASSSPYLVAIHATSRAEKHWPEAAWAALLDAICAKGIAVKLPWGSDPERARAERLAQISPHIQVLPKSTLTQLASIIAQARGAISVDTGLAHLAAALNTPNISLYGATDPRLIGCYGQHQHYLQANKMSHISVEQVWQSLNQQGLLG